MSVATVAKGGGGGSWTIGNVQMAFQYIKKETKTVWKILELCLCYRLSKVSKMVPEYSTKNKVWLLTPVCLG